LETTVITFKPMGTIHTPFTEREGTPIQPIAAEGVKGRIEVDPAFADGLKDLDGFSHIILIYHFHKSHGYSLHLKPFLDDELRGVFATKAPRRPNPIGLSVVRLTGVHGNILDIEDVDMLDGTPLLDIKPFVPKFDNRNAEKIGWVAGKEDTAKKMKADDRFGMNE
jgi:tRNA-Thr(GGU) m(6)t(6)A37 methyltransferase TsaA